MTDNADLRTQYAAKLDADLQHNTQEKERIAAELASLTNQLTALDADSTLLTSMRQALAGEPTAPHSAPPSAQPVTEAPVRGRTKKTETPVPRPRKAAAKKATAKHEKTTTKPPTLRELVVADLNTHTEPASAADVATALGKAHPARTVQVTVVRNTLEGLVAKGQALRNKQKRAVFYTAAPADTSKAPTIGTDTPQEL